MMGKYNSKHILMILLTIAVIFGCGFNAKTTYSWFYAETGANVAATSGHVSYKPDETTTGGEYGSFIESTKADDESSYIYPSRELVKAALQLKNSSDIDTNVRVVINGIVEKTEKDGTKRTYPLIRDENQRSTGHWRLGVMYEGDSVSDGSAVARELIPLLEVLFQETTVNDVTYEWKPAAGDGSISSPGAIIWELCLKDQTIDKAVIPAAPEGQLYGTITSAAVVSTLEETGDSPEEILRKENVFTELYTGGNLHITVGYYAKQRESMEWNQFYQTELVI